MRIVYLFTSLGMGGAERQGLAVAERMAGRSHQVSIMVLRPVLREQWSTTLSVIHLNINKNPIKLLAAIAQGRRFLNEFKPDIVHSHSFHANLFARLLKLFVPSITQISTIHNTYEGGGLRMLSYRITDRLSRCTVAVSQAAADRFVRLKAIPRNKCLVIANAIDATEFLPEPARRLATRNLMYAGSDFIWLAAGRIVPAKDFPNLLRAFAEVNRTVPQSQLWIAGEAGAVASKIMNGDHGANGVRWLDLRRDMPALFDAADGFVLSSAWEGMPLVIGEAMAMELPIVATDVGGVRELSGDCARLVQSRSCHALAAVMLAVMRLSSSERAHLGYASRARIQHFFNMDAKVEEWNRLYHSVLNLSS